MRERFEKSNKNEQWLKDLSYGIGTSAGNDGGEDEGKGGGEGEREVKVISRPAAHALRRVLPHLRAG